MFEFVRKHNRLMLLVLVLLIFPSFVFFGIQGYDRLDDASNVRVARVDGQDITQAEWDAAHRAQVERARIQVPDLDARVFDSPAARRETLESLVRERVLFTAARKLNLETADTRLQRVFATDPQFASLRKADGSLDRDALAAQGLNSEQFAQRLRQDLSMRQVLLGAAASVFAPGQVADAAFDALLQQREVQVLQLRTREYLGQVAPSDADVEAFYKDPTNQTLVSAPESARIEYLVLDLDAIKRNLKVDEEELHKYYAENAARYTVPQERRARHILVKVDASATAAERAAAKAKAQALLEQVRATPATFADVARKNSDDPGSAANGGDLDFFGRGAMVKPFEDAAFALDVGGLSPVVETDFGYHVIRVDAIRGGEKKSFEAAREEILGEVRQQLAQRRYAESAEQFSNLVYEQHDSLQPAAERLGLALRTATVTREPAAGASGVLASPKLLDALFAPGSVRDKRNTEAIEVRPNEMVAARVLQHTPAHARPLAEVKDMIRGRLATRQAAALVDRLGQDLLTKAREGVDVAGLSAVQSISRARAGQLPGAVVEAALRADASRLPAWVGVSTGDEGYTLVKVVKVLGRDPVLGDAVRARAQYAQAWGGAEAQAYYAALKTRYKAQTEDGIVETLLRGASGGTDR